LDVEFDVFAVAGVFPGVSAMLSSFFHLGYLECGLVFFAFKRPAQWTLQGGGGVAESKS